MDWYENGNMFFENTTNAIRKKIYIEIHLDAHNVKPQWANGRKPLCMGIYKI